jgi:hypothetical protein
MEQQPHNTNKMVDGCNTSDYKYRQHSISWFSQENAKRLSVFIFIEQIDGFVYRPPRMLQQFMLQILLMLHPEHNSKSCSSSSGPNRCFIFDLVKALETWLKRDNYKYIRTKVKERITNADHCT